MIVLSDLEWRTNSKMWLLTSMNHWNMVGWITIFGEREKLYKLYAIYLTKIIRKLLDDKWKTTQFYMINNLDYLLMQKPMLK